MLKYLSIGLIVVLGVIACKKKYVNDYIGPEKQIDYKLVEPFQVSTKSIDFTDADTNRVYFKATVDKPTNIRVTITGLDSYAQRNLTMYGTKFDSSLFWAGEQDELFYFRDGEKCVVTFTSVDDADVNNVTVTLKDRGVVVDHGVLFATDTITIRKKKGSIPHQVRLFPKMPMTGPEGAAAYIAGYDDESNLDIRKRVDKWDTIGFIGASITKYVFINPSLLPYSKGGQSITGDRFFMLQGVDKVSKYEPKEKPDYYLGRLALAGNIKLNGTPSNANKSLYGGSGLNLSDSLKGYSPNDVYLNVFVYGNGDNSQINFTVKELEHNGNFEDRYDESYEAPILINFKGWKLFSFKYSEFTYAPTKDTKLGKGAYYNGIKEPTKITSVQFGLVAGKLGGFGQMIIDNPMISWGGPLKY